MKYVVLLGRILFSSIFLVKSVQHFSKGAIEHAVQMGVWAPHFLVPASGILALLGGLSILLGYRAKEGAWLLVVFLLPTTLCMHKFWTASTSYESLMEQYCFMKNLSLLGASLLLTYFGSGPLSLKKS